MSTTPNDGLTTKQRKIRDYVRDHVLSKGYGPSVREIGERFGINSPNGVLTHLRALEKKGAMMPAEKNGRKLARAFVFPKA